MFKKKSDYQKMCEEKINELCGGFLPNDNFQNLKSRYGKLGNSTSNTYEKTVLKTECEKGQLSFEDIENRLIELLQLDCEALSLKIRYKTDTSNFKTQDDILEFMGEEYAQEYYGKLETVKQKEEEKLRKENEKEEMKLQKEQEKALKKKLKEEEKLRKDAEKEEKRVRKEQEKALKKKLKEEEKLRKDAEKEEKRVQKEQEKALKLEHKKEKAYEEYNIFDGVRATIIFPETYKRTKRIDNSWARMYATKKWGDVGALIPDDFVQEEYHRSISAIVQVVDKGIVIKHGNKDDSDLRIPYEEIVGMVEDYNGYQRLILLGNKSLTIKLDSKGWFSDVDLARNHFAEVVNQRALGKKHEEPGWGLDSEQPKIQTSDNVEIKSDGENIIKLPAKFNFIAAGSDPVVKKEFKLMVRIIDKDEYNEFLNQAKNTNKDINEIIVEECFLSPEGFKLPSEAFSCFTKEDIDGIATKLLDISKKYKRNFLNSIDETEDSDNISVADELLKYAELFDKGLLTKEEFDKLKSDLLNK